MSDIRYCTTTEIGYFVPLKTSYNFTLQASPPAPSPAVGDMSLEDILSGAGQPEASPKYASEETASLTVDSFQLGGELDQFASSLCLASQNTVKAKLKYSADKWSWLSSDDNQVVLIDKNKEAALKTAINPYLQSLSGDVQAPQHPEDHKRWIPAPEVMGELDATEISFLKDIFPAYVREYEWITKSYFSTSISPIAFTQAIKTLDELITSPSSARDHARLQALKAGLEAVKKQLRPGVFASFIINDTIKEPILQEMGKISRTGGGKPDVLSTAWEAYLHYYKRTPPNPEAGAFSNALNIGFFAHDRTAKSAISQIERFSLLKTFLSLRDIYHLQAFLGETDCFRILEMVKDPTDLDREYTVLIRTNSWLGEHEISFQNLLGILKTLQNANQDTNAQARLSDFIEEITKLEESVYQRSTRTHTTTGSIGGVTFGFGMGVFGLAAGWGGGLIWERYKKQDVKDKSDDDSDSSGSGGSVGLVRRRPSMGPTIVPRPRPRASASKVVVTPSPVPTPTYFPSRVPASAKPVSSSSATPSVQEAWRMPVVSPETLYSGLRWTGVGLAWIGGGLSVMCATAAPGSVALALPTGGVTLLADGTCIVAGAGIGLFGTALITLGNSGLKQ